MHMTSTKPTTFNSWLILVCINGAAPVTIVWKYHSGEISSAVALFSGAIVLALVNIAALLGIQRRSKRNGSSLRRRFVVGAMGLAIAAFLATLLGLSLVQQRNEYAGLAMSDVPLAQIEPERKRIVVELIRRTAEISQEENNSMAEVQKVPMNPAVYTPESFANKQIMQSTLAQLTKYSEIDFQYYAKTQDLRQDFRRKMAACDAEYLKSWDAGRKEQEDKDQSTNRLEHDWLTSVNALYVFAEQHAGDIAVKDGKVSVPNPAVREIFNNLLAQSKALHARLESTVQEQVKAQKQAQAEIAE